MKRQISKTRSRNKKRALTIGNKMVEINDENSKDVPQTKYL